jgi:hypothetical protein
VSEESAARAYAPLPLADLLAALRARGLPLGVREHLTVGRLLERFDDPDLETLRVALAAVLARHPAEVELVRETFDELYARTEEPPPPPTWPQRLAGTGSRLRRRIQLRWAAWLAAAALTLALGVFAGSWLWHRLHPPQPEPPGNVPPPAEAPADRPPPPLITDTYSVRNRYRALAASGGVAMLAFLWLYLVRTRQHARRRALLHWSDALDALPGPQSYDLVLKDLPPPFTSEVLDDVATVLGRQSTGVPYGRELDVDRTLERTLRAGLAPQIVLRTRAVSRPLLVLADVAADMGPWERRIEALLAGLAARGIPLDRWRFNADASRLFRAIGEPSLSLKQLTRLRAESPLLVISAGRGVLEGEDFALAPWVGMLRTWRYRAWLHPASDPRTWTSALRQVPFEVWPMTPAGLLAAARQVARGDVRLPGLKDARTPQERWPTPLDVDRLRWLLTLAPRREPDLAELLRRRFCPHVPEAALIEALAAPPLDRPPGVGPTPAEVHEFLLSVLDDSRPLPGSVGHERWRLDRALQQVALAPQAAAADLASLAAGPLAGEVERALRPLPRETTLRLRSKVLRPLRRRATREGLLGEPAAKGFGLRWTWPTAGEIAAALLVAVLTWGAVPWFGKVFNDEVPVRQKIAYDVEVSYGAGNRVLLLVKARGGPRRDVDLYQDAYPFGRMEPLDKGLETTRDVQGHWYYVRSRIDRETLAVSAPVWVAAANPANTPPDEVATTDFSNESMGTDIPAEIPKTEPKIPVVAQSSLEPGYPVDRELRGGEVHVYLVELKAGQYVHLVALQRGIDILLRLRGPDGGIEAQANSSSSGRGQEELSYVPQTSGLFRVEIMPAMIKARSGRYELRLDPLRPATKSERLSVEMQKSLPSASTGTLVVRFKPSSPTARTFQLRVGQASRSGREGQEIQLPAGRYTISSVFMAKPRATTINPGKRTSLSIPLDLGALNIVVPKDASPKSVFIDGQPWNGERLLPAGRVTVELKDDRYGDLRAVAIVAGQTITVKLARRRPGDDINGPAKSVTELPGIEQQPYVERETLVREGDPVEIPWDCGEERSAEVVYELRDGEEFVGAKWDFLEVIGARRQKPETPVYDETLRQVRGKVTFWGLQDLVKGKANSLCGPGQARVRLLVTVRLTPRSKK